jgi:hypothetical protein
MYKLIIGIALGLVFSKITAQNQFEIKGKVFDLTTRKPAYQILVSNKRTNQTVLTDTSGNFTLKAYFNDSICTQSIAYNFDCMIVTRESIIAKRPFIFLLRPKIFQIDEVTVTKKVFVPYYDRPWKTLNNETQVYTPGKLNLGAFFSPATYLYQRYSKKFINLRKVYALNEIDRANFRLNERITQTVIDYAGIKEEDFEAFTKQLRLSSNFIDNSSDYEFMVRIKQEYDKFRVVEEE